MTQKFRVGDEVEAVWLTKLYKAKVVRVEKRTFTVDIFFPIILDGLAYSYIDQEEENTKNFVWKLSEPYDPIKARNKKIQVMWERQPYVKQLRIKQCSGTTKRVSSMS